MPFRDTYQTLRDIADGIVLIEQFTAEMDFETFREDPRTIAAVERMVRALNPPPAGPLDAPSK